MDSLRLKELFRKYVDNTISETERQEFYNLVAKPQSIKLLRKYSEAFHDFPSIDLPKDIASKILSDILLADNENSSDNESLFKIQYKPKNRSVRKKKYLKLFSIVSIALFFIAIYLNNGRHKGQSIVLDNQVIKDAKPGHSGAVLTLSNGTSYLLDTAKNGMIRPGIKKSENGISVVNENEIYYATLETPYGRTQKIILSDGTRVWLNAGSSIHFPSKFKGPERRVELTGEAYFEVVHNENQPFIVIAGNDEIKDLGTHFEVKAYCDESVVKTTLLEGSVQIGDFVLKPGQQYANGQIKYVDTTEAIAWVSGFFHFENAGIKEVMQQLSRWYNVQVDYVSTVPSQQFEGEIQRSLNLSQVLRLIAGTGIHYTLNGNKLTIRP